MSIGLLLQSINELDMSEEQDASILDSQKKSFAGKKDRFDAQFANMSNLLVDN